MQQAFQYVFQRGQEYVSFCLIIHQNEGYKNNFALKLKFYPILYYFKQPQVMQLKVLIFFPLSGIKK